jgi:uncharacterized protein (TIGR02246 family)
VHSSDDQRAIAERSAKLVASVNASDVAGVMSVWSDDGVLMPPHHAAVRGRAAIESYFRQLFQRARLRFVFTESVISIDERTATERLSYTAETWLAGSATPIADRGKGLHVYTRESGSWKLAMDVWNTDTPRTS